MVMQKKIYYVTGTHCRSCEILLEDELSKIDGVSSVSVNYGSGKVSIEYDGSEPRYGNILKAVKSLGYDMGQKESLPLISKNPVVYFWFILSVAIVAIIYLVFASLDISLAGFKFGAKPSYLTVLLIGLTAGLSTCMALVGGLLFGISARHAEIHPEATFAQKFKPHIFFNLGRVASFGLLGGLIGLFGSVFRLSGLGLGLIVVIAGLTMLMLGLKLTEISPRFSATTLSLPKGLARFFGVKTETKEYSHKSAFVSGALTFFLPCGFTQAMQVYAISTGSFLGGGTVMLLFAIGTLPGLIGIGSITSLVNGSIGKALFRFVGLVLLILGLWTVTNGYNLTGFNLDNISQGKTVERDNGVEAQMVDGYQIVEITQSARGYSPNKIQVKNGIPVKLTVIGTDLYSCSSSFVIREYGVGTYLKEGRNELTFTPTRTGSVKFSCAMGMYTGIINVV